MELSIDVHHKSDEKKIAVVVGEVDVYTAPKLKEALLSLVKDGDTTVEVNMDEVNYIDSTGLGVFISVLKATKERGGHLQLVNVQGSVARLFDITGLDKVIDVRMSIEEGSES